ncbi:hypothetical protein [Microbacterium sp. ru370.1]|nr:hypothetical protein [Microbacterium sp. ru370.1]
MTEGVDATASAPSFVRGCRRASTTGRPAHSPVGVLWTLDRGDDDTC